MNVAVDRFFVDTNVLPTGRQRFYRLVLP